MSQSDGFFGRWSSRKRQAAEAQRTSDVSNTEPGTSDREVDAASTDLLTDAPVLTPGVVPESVPAMSGLPENCAPETWHETTVVQESAEREPGSAEEDLLLSDEQMPAIETLTANSDLSVFFNKGVSAKLRKAALRHVFHQPAFNVRDGLDDYDDDYTVFEPLGDTVTADMKFHALRKEQQQRADSHEPEHLMSSTASEAEEPEAEELEAEEKTSQAPIQEPEEACAPDRPADESHVADSSQETLASTGPDQTDIVPDNR